MQGAYTEVPNIYFASGASDKIFEVTYDDNYNGTIIFGDGSVGISPEDTAAYTVFYRIGGGSRGNLAKNSINTSITALVNGSSETVSITNVSKATGGSNAETVDHAKKYAPLEFRRQDRLVTLGSCRSSSSVLLGQYR